MECGVHRQCRAEVSTPQEEGEGQVVGEVNVMLCQIGRGAQSISRAVREVQVGEGRRQLLRQR